MTDSDAQVQDVEMGPMKRLTNSIADMFGLLEAAALLTIWSVLVINEGAIRFADTAPSEGLDSTGNGPPPVIYFISSLGEVAFGLLGLAVGAAALVLQRHSVWATKATMVVQTILGYLVFVIYVFLRPAYAAHELEESPIPDMTLDLYKFLVTLGIFTSFHFCLALQGGQFVFMARLVCAATGDNFLMQKSGDKMRAIFWNLNMALAGLWTLITGAILANADLMDMPYVFPPNVGTLPAFTIVTGLVMLVWGIVGVAMAGSTKAPLWYFCGTAVTYLLMFFNYGIGQLSTFVTPAGTTLSAPIAMHNGLVFVVVLLGPYFVKKHADSKIEY